MRIATLKGRAGLVAGARALDVEQASGGKFDSDPQSAWADWPAFCAWAASIEVVEHLDSTVFDTVDLGAPVPRPGQVFAIGLNYADQASEAKMELLEHPLVFTKFPSSLTGPVATIVLSGDRVDWKAELVVVTLDEVRASADPGALAIGCRISEGEDAGLVTLQKNTTRDLIFTGPQLVAQLSAVVELRPGDLIFTGTPFGVGMGRDPQVFLRPGQRLVTEIEGLGTLEQRFVRLASFGLRQTMRSNCAVSRTASSLRMTCCVTTNSPESCRRAPSFPRFSWQHVCGSPEPLFGKLFVDLLPRGSSPVTSTDGCGYLISTSTTSTRSTRCGSRSSPWASGLPSRYSTTGGVPSWPKQSSGWTPQSRQGAGRAFRLAHRAFHLTRLVIEDVRG